MKWVSNNTKDALAGTVFQNEIGVRIHRLHGCDGWYLSCHELAVTTHHLAAETFDDAVAESRQLIKERLAKIEAKYHSFLEDDTKPEIASR